jgi:hypothetical protein
MSHDSNTSAGFRCDGGPVRVILPSCIRGSGVGSAFETVTLADVTRLFRVLRRYHLEDERERSTAREVRGLQDPAVRASDAGLHWIECALELLDDYRERGLLRYERRITGRTRRGRIDWRTTVRRELACLSDAGSLYLMPFRNAAEAQGGHPLTGLHAETIRRLCQAFGSEFGVEVPPRPDKPFPPGMASKTLRQERNRVFRDRDRRVVRLLEQYWLGTVVGRTKGFREDLLWTDQFEFLWQRMAERVIGKVKADGGQLPKGRYLEDGQGRRGMDLRPDLVVDVEPGVRVVFDAKYYGAGSLPPSGDVLKQLAYAYFASSRWDPSLPNEVVSIFLLPGESPGRAVRLSGRHRLVGIEEQPAGRPLADDIWLFRVDYRSLADAYLDGSSWGCNQFLDQIRRAGASELAQSPAAVK